MPWGQGNTIPFQSTNFAQLNLRRLIRNSNPWPLTKLLPILELPKLWVPWQPQERFAFWHLQEYFGLKWQVTSAHTHPWVLSKYSWARTSNGSSWPRCPRLRSPLSWSPRCAHKFQLPVTATDNIYSRWPEPSQLALSPILQKIWPSSRKGSAADLGLAYASPGQVLNVIFPDTPMHLCGHTYR